MLRSTLRTTSGANVIIRDELHSCTSNIISRMALGKRFNEVSCSSNEINFVKTLLEAIRCLGILNISDFFPSLEWMDLQVSVVSPNIGEYRKINTCQCIS